jgi:hypothetical protein
MEADGYVKHLANGWQLIVGELTGECVAWLTHNSLATGWYETVVAGTIFLDLDCLGYVPSIYHDGGETPPLVFFHAAQRDRDPYVWEPKSGRVYQSGAGRHA